MPDKSITKIELKDPIAWGDKKLTEISFRAPCAGDLRGVSISGIAQMEVEHLLKLLPRIAIENITAAQLETLSARDTTRLFHGVQGFFVD
ncbi:phage tail assembly protein [Kiloniella laminariae]|uniref:Phage tail assembly protein n=1 Tax=Kiloniella laminariae TaxID=454162 RepID=A0ABT4LKR0_9PROT|nr:phage tail assembly protein [Kiloniella laminariae]MCZ4281694.1 phage tail assembly protein [Kiloniella laminariae]